MRLRRRFKPTTEEIAWSLALIGGASALKGKAKKMQDTLNAALQPSDVTINIQVRPFGGSPLNPQYRAGTEIQGKAFIGASRPTKLEALTQLLAQLAGVSGGYGDEVNVRLDMELNGGFSFAPVNNVPQITEGQDK